MPEHTDTVNNKKGRSNEMKDLIKEWLELKQAETEAKEKRRELGAKIAAKLECPSEGSKSHKVDVYTVTVKGVVNRNILATPSDHDRQLALMVETTL